MDVKVLGGGDFRRTESADETESVEISTGLLSDASVVESVGPSTSSSLGPEVGASSFNGEDFGD